MKLENVVVPPVFSPVVLTMETQAEVDFFYAVFASMHGGLESAFGIAADTSWKSYKFLQQFASQKPLPYLSIDVRQDVVLDLHTRIEF